MQEMWKEPKCHLAETEQRQKLERRGFLIFLYLTFCTLSFKKGLRLGFNFQAFISLGIE